MLAFLRVEPLKQDTKESFISLAMMVAVGALLYGVDLLKHSSSWGLRILGMLAELMFTWPGIVLGFAMVFAPLMFLIGILVTNRTEHVRNSVWISAFLWILLWVGLLWIAASPNWAKVLHGSD